MPRARSRWGVYRASGLVLGSNPAVHGAGTKRVFYPLASANPVSVSNFFAYVEDRFVREYAGQRAPVSTCICALFHFEHSFVLAAARIYQYAAYAPLHEIGSPPWRGERAGRTI